MAAAAPSNPAGLVPTPLQLLSAVDIADLAARFTAVAIDADLRTVANGFAQAVTSGMPASVIEQRWHHLVMTAGNFKRQAPIDLSFRLQPMAPVQCPPFQLPGAPQDVPMISPTNGYEALDNITGVGVPTATTILSVLWPDDHLIIDRFDLYTAVGLVQANQPGPVPQAELRAWTNGPIAWADYEWLRSVTQQTRGLPGSDKITLLQVEKALFELYQLLPAATRRSDQWAPFVLDLTKVLQRCPGCQVFGFQQHKKGCASARCNTHLVSYSTNPCRHWSPASPAWQWRP